MAHSFSAATLLRAATHLSRSSFLTTSEKLPQTNNNNCR